jgi:subtilisin family serine protease
MEFSTNNGKNRVPRSSNRKGRVLFALAVFGLAHNISFATEYIVRSPGTSLFDFSGQSTPQFKVMNLNDAQVKTMSERGLILEINRTWQLQNIVQDKSKFSPLRGPLPVNQGDGQWAINYIQSPQTNLLDFGNGEGVTVCIVDTGVDRNHPSLAGQVVDDLDLTESVPDPNSQEISYHGTTVASIIAGNILPEHRGVAPKAKILSVKIFSNGVDTTTDLVVKGISYCLGKSQVISLSFGGEMDSQIISETLQRAINSGVTVLAAAGNNSGPILYPANEPGVIAVGAMDQNLRVADFSSRGPELGAVAPGLGVLAAARAGTFSNVSGTSISVAVASGVELLRRSRQAKHLGFINLNIGSDLQGQGMVHALLTASKIRD